LTICLLNIIIIKKMVMYTREMLNEIAEGAILLNGFDNCILGITEEFGCGPRVLYSKRKILNELSNNGVIDRGESLEYYYYNIVGSYFGEQNPIFLDDEI